MKNNKPQLQEFFTLLQQNDLTKEQKRRFFLAILSDESHGVLKLTEPGSLQYTAISNVIALLNDNCQDPKVWQAARTAAEAAEAAARKAGFAAARTGWAAARVTTEDILGSAARAAAEAAEAAWCAGAAADAATLAAGLPIVVANAAWAAAEATAWKAMANALIASQDAAERHYQWMALILSQILKENT